jgi:hypothetical protein
MKKLINGKTFIIPCMRAGLCQYDDERVLVSNETLAAMAKTSFGIPLILPEHVEQSELEKNLDQYLAGRVADMHYDEKEDLWMAHCVADTQEAVDLFSKGWGVSTSYRVDKKGPGGTLNAVEYGSEIQAGTYLHLAIVEKPRYEMATDPVFYNSVSLTSETESHTIENSEPKKGAFTMKFWKTKREEVKENDASEIEIEIDGEKVPLTNLIEAYKASKNAVPAATPAETPAETPAVNEEPGVEPGKPEPKPGEKPVESSEKPAEPTDEEQVNTLLASLENEEPKDEEKPKEKEEVEGKKNSRFNSMREASSNSNTLDNGLAGFLTIHERAELGKKRYGK